MHAVKVDGQDVEAVYRATIEALEHAREGHGPVFLHVEHLPPHRPLRRRPAGLPRRRTSCASLRETEDPITKLRERLGLSDEECEQLDREVHELVDESVEFAKTGTDPKPEDALKNVYA